MNTRARITTASAVALLAVGIPAAAHAQQITTHLLPGHHVTVANATQGFGCPAGHEGKPFAAGYHLLKQHWTADHSIIAWPNFDDGRVTFNGLTFTNTTRAIVRVGLTC